MIDFLGVLIITRIHLTLGLARIIPKRRMCTTKKERDKTRIYEYIIIKSQCKIGRITK